MPTLQRLDDNMWSFQLMDHDPSPDADSKNPTPLNMIDVRIHSRQYEIAHLAANLVKATGLPQLKSKPVEFEVPNVRSLAGKWRVSMKREEASWLTRVRQSIPFLRKISNHNVVNIQVENLQESCLPYKRVLNVCRSTVQSSQTFAMQPTDIPRTKRAMFVTDSSLEQKLRCEPFTDPFTTVATDALQNWEEVFVPQKKIHSKYALLLQDEEVVLRLNQGFSDQLELEQTNQDMLNAYKNFVVEEYGADVLQYIQHRYEFNLDQMIATGEPLTPEHVYRVNIGVNNIEMQGVENLLTKLYQVHDRLSEFLGKTRVDDFFLAIAPNRGVDGALTNREMRGIFNALTETSADIMPTVHDLRRWLEQFLPKTKVKKAEELSLDKFNVLLNMLMVPDAFRDRIYTGRKITHLPIMGFYTMAETVHFKPWVDQQELLQSFPDMRKTEDWDNFYEMLSHVAAKKHLVRQHPIEKWRVGALIPAPDSKSGKRRWYRVESCLDNDHGDFNYTLVPACNESGLTHIKLYRSTASDPYAMNGAKSVQADLDHRAPGAGFQELGHPYELPFFRQRTIPIWVGYLHLAKSHYDELANALEVHSPFNLNDQDETEEAMQTRFAQCLESMRSWCRVARHYENGAIPLLEELVHECQSRQDSGCQDPAATMRKLDFEQLLATLTNEPSGEIMPEIVCKESIERLHRHVQALKTHAERLHALLSEQADIRQERIEDKIPADIAFVGHSLGGALAQKGMCHFGVESGRIPLPGHKYICYASDPPAISPEQAQTFLEFGEKHQDLLKALKQRWKITHQMEYGDVVPQGGSLHLGATDKDPSTYSHWLDIKIRVFKPLDTAQIKEIRDAPTHGRRVGLGTEGRDFKFTYLTPAALHRFHNSYWLNSEQQRVWGYKLLNGPRLTEILRTVIAYCQKPIYKLRSFKQLFQPVPGTEIRDANNVFFCSYHERLPLNLSQ